MSTQEQQNLIACAAFDTIAAAQAVTTIDELNAAFRNNLADLGFDIFVGLDMVDSVGRPNVRVLFGHTHEPWETHYRVNRYDRFDSMVREALYTTEPYYWSDITDSRPISPEAGRIINEAGEFGLREGFLTPLHNVDGSISAVLLTGKFPDPRDPHARAAAHLLSIYYGAIGRRLRQAEVTPHHRIRLTPRQTECLKWVREGKSSNDIGDILGLSNNTVDEYIANACARLGVRTRTQAVVEAALRGLLSL